MALDEQRENDEMYEVDGFQYLVDKDFLAQARPIKIDYIVNGFKLDCGIDFGGSGCGGCGTDTNDNGGSCSC